ncbi:unnamed protein product [Mytilus coruscus]|uniref:t-SNARE coiled-coil homology domain-containing protein n=1 Tax=Mytilus coruscus TaxID=42192 RepID=A0A6J8EQJ9_MYTCO|nr:unnamed protein product [Mytilus coruscus]
MDVSISNMFFFVTFVSFTLLSFGANINRYQVDDLSKNPFGFLTDFLNLLKDDDRNLTVIPLVMSNISKEINSHLQEQMKSINHIDTILDQYPDNYNKSFSNVKNINGTKVVTNTTIFKSKNDDSMTGMYMKEKSVDGKSKFLQAHMILHPKHPAMNNTV